MDVLCALYDCALGISPVTSCSGVKWSDELSDKNGRKASSRSELIASEASKNIYMGGMSSLI